MQERTASPFTCTVQAPHMAMPHPNLVPVMLRASRRTHSSGISGAASTVCGFPFKVNLMDATQNLLRDRVGSRDGQIRTAALSLRRRPLYPSELRPHTRSDCSKALPPRGLLPAFQAFMRDVMAVMHSNEVNFSDC